MAGVTRRVVLASVVLPLLSAVLFAGYLAVIRDRLPEESAIHWGLGGTPDGFIPSSGLPIVLLGLSVMVTALMAVFGRDAARSIVGRPVRGLANGTVWFLGTLVTVAATVQIGRATPPPLPGWSIALAAGVGLVGGWLAVEVSGPSPKVPHSARPGPADVDRFELAEGHTVVWSGRSPAAPAPIVLGGAVLALGVVVSAFASWWLFAVLAPIAMVLVASSTFRVTLGRGMIDVSGRVFGFPRVRIPLSEVERVDAGRVDAWDFGGWGVRIGGGRRDGGDHQIGSSSGDHPHRRSGVARLPRRTGRGCCHRQHPAGPSLVIIAIDLDSPAPLYAQIVDGVVRAIATGRLAPGERLPPGRELAATLDVNLETVQRAYRELSARGVVDARVGRGTRIRQDIDPEILGRPHLPALRAEFTAQANAQPGIHEEARLDYEVLEEASPRADQLVREPTVGLDDSNPPFFKWFADGS
jgi:DNA-binding transcriptional regulator YhcF (GntR family)